MLKDDLIDFGMDEKESRLYLALLELGEAAKFMETIHSCKETFLEDDCSVLSEGFFKIKKDTPLYSLSRGKRTHKPRIARQVR